MSSSDPVILDDRAVGEKFYRVANECHQTFWSPNRSYVVDCPLVVFSILPKPLPGVGFLQDFD